MNVERVIYSRQGILAYLSGASHTYPSKDYSQVVKSCSHAATALPRRCMLLGVPRAVRCESGSAFLRQGCRAYQQPALFLRTYGKKPFNEEEEVE